MLDPLPTSKWDFTTAAHLLNRAGFGGPPSEIEKLAALGMEAAVDQFVDFEKIPDDVAKPEWAHPDPERMAKFREMRQSADEEKRREFQREYQQEQRRNLVELRGWWLQRMAKGSRPLQEKLVLFWHGHFATSVQKVKDAYLMWLQNDTFRRHAAGSWLALLEDVSRDPAMLVWLDQAQSRREHPNENYAREVMELFALGEGHYSEKDVTEAARAFTGWSYNRLTQQFVNNRFQHDPGSKTVLGKTGNLNGSDVLAQIVSQPQSGRFICEKLWRFFANDNPLEKTIAALADVFAGNGNQFRPVLRALFRSAEFYAPDVIRNQVKSPVQWLVGSTRLLQRELPVPQICHLLLANLGQELFAPPNVKGWDGGIAWITTNNLLNRYNDAAVLLDGAAAMQLIEGARGMRGPGPMPFRGGRPGLRGVAVRPSNIFSPEERRDRDALLAALERRFLQAKLKPAQEKTLRDYLDAQGKLGDAEILHAIRLIMATPEFQLA